MRWQDRCVEIRDAAQALLLAELSRVGMDGRKKLVEVWANYLPQQLDPFVQPSTPAAQGGTGMTPASTPSRSEVDEEEEDEEEQEPSLKPSPSEYKRKQTTAIILLGVLGAEFGEELTSTTKESKKGVEGFGISNSNLARLTSKLFSPS